MSELHLVVSVVWNCNFSLKLIIINKFNKLSFYFINFHKKKGNIYEAAPNKAVIKCPTSID